MNANDKTVPFPVPPTSNDGAGPPPRRMRQRLATRWHAPGRPDSWPRARLQEIRDVPSAGWRHIATWIRTVIVLTALTAITLLGWWSINALIALQPWTALGDTGLLATVIHPVHGYLTAHTRDLPVDAQMAYRTWEVVGGATFLTSTIFKATCARLTWTAWGAATTAMVWIASRPAAVRSPPSLWSSAGLSPPPSRSAACLCARSSPLTCTTTRRSGSTSTPRPPW